MPAALKVRATANCARSWGWHKFCWAATVQLPCSQTRAVRGDQVEIAAIVINYPGGEHQRPTVTQHCHHAAFIARTDQCTLQLYNPLTCMSEGYQSVYTLTVQPLDMHV